MPLTPGRFVFCERGRILDICQNVEGIRIENTEAKLEGYQIYLVEQWAIERNREVATAVSFTGDPVHKTPYGQLFVTNLSLFASSLNIVLVPYEGDFDLYQRRFYLNLNLRRMGCSGRSALTSKSPSDAQREKFNQLYKISDSTDFEETVIRLVNLVQNCLFIFGLFKLSDVDGLLCNATKKGLDEFHETFLSSKSQKFPSDNALDPSVLAGMFSKLSNIRGKLQHLVNNVPKDPFAEPVAFISAVKAFQIKKPDLKACFLNLKTVEAITAAYQSSFNPQGLKVHKVLKSKIEDFSGMTAVNPEGETTDLEEFAKHIHTDSLKLVWRGKPKHKPDMADALANGDWLTGGKELGKSLVRGLAKTSLLLPKGKGSPITNMKEGVMTEDTLIASTQADNYSPKSDDERNDGYESEEAPATTVIAPSTTNLQGSEEDAPSTSVADVTPQSSSVAAFPSLDILASLFSLKPEPPGPPEIVVFRLDKGSSHRASGPLSPRKRSQSLTGLQGQERLLGCRYEAAKECDTHNYYSYQLLKEKEETLKNMYDRMQVMEQELSGQLESLKMILSERGKQFEEMELEVKDIQAERRELLAEVWDLEHSTQRSVYHLEGMVGKLIEMRDFTGAFFNKISYLDTKLPVSQRRLALWMDRLQALQSQWLRTIGRYMIDYAPSGIRNRFTEWERNVQLAAKNARELRGEVGDIHLTDASTRSAASAVTSAAHNASSASLTGTVVSRSSTSLLRSVGVVSAPSMSSYMVTPQALKTEGDDSEKDVSRFLRYPLTHPGGSCLLKDCDEPAGQNLPSSSEKSGLKSEPRVSKGSFPNLSSLEWMLKGAGGSAGQNSSKSGTKKDE
ncbi:hypothetical protein BGZ58_005154 [Dissophora ornata]|nr:hypothetical protein BGZ58_005154 [Dissophora ornata]